MCLLGIVGRLGVSWGVLGCPGVSWGNKTDPSSIRSRPVTGKNNKSLALTREVNLDTLSSDSSEEEIRDSGRSFPVTKRS